MISCTYKSPKSTTFCLVLFCVRTCAINFTIVCFKVFIVLGGGDVSANWDVWIEFFQLTRRLIFFVAGNSGKRIRRNNALTNLNICEESLGEDRPSYQISLIYRHCPNSIFLQTCKGKGQAHSHPFQIGFLYTHRLPGQTGSGQKLSEQVTS